MKSEIYAKGRATIDENYPKIESLKKEKLTKKKRLLIYLLGGRPVTGAMMIAYFHIYSYRDVIYDLKQDGWEINSKLIVEKGVEHRIWWLACFDEEFALAREEKMF